MTFDTDEEYAINGVHMQLLQGICQRLYDDGRPFAVDERRDISNQFDYILSCAEALNQVRNDS